MLHVPIRDCGSDPPKAVRKEVIERMRNIGINIGKERCIVYVADGKGRVHDVSRDSSGPSAFGKIPEVFKASFVVAVQPVVNPRGTAYLNAGSILHEHVKHAHGAPPKGANLCGFALTMRHFQVPRA